MKTALRDGQGTLRYDLRLYVRMCTYVPVLESERERENRMVFFLFILLIHILQICVCFNVFVIDSHV